jgi:hypothetical protein
MKVDELVADERRELAKYLRRAQAAQYVRNQYGFPCSTALLDKLASLGGGPVYRRANRVPLYAREDLDAWAEARISAPMGKASETSDDRSVEKEQ